MHGGRPLPQRGAQVAHGPEGLGARLLQGLEQRLFQGQAGLFVQATWHCKGVGRQIQQGVTPRPEIGRVRTVNARQLLHRLVEREQFRHQRQFVRHGSIGLLQHRQQGLLDDDSGLRRVAGVGRLQAGKREFTAVHQQRQGRTAAGLQSLRAAPQGRLDHSLVDNFDDNVVTVLCGGTQPR